MLSPDEKKFQYEREKFQRFLKLSERLGGLGYWEHDFGTEKTELSDELLNIFEETRRENIEPKDLLKIHPSDEANYFEFLKASIESQKFGEFQYRIITKTGKVKTLNYTAEIVKDENGTPIKIFGVVRDMTNLRHMENLFRKKYDFEKALKEISLRISTTSKKSFISDVAELLQLIGDVSGASRVLLIKYHISKNKRVVVSEWLSEVARNRNPSLGIESEIHIPSQIVKKKLAYEVCRIQTNDSELSEYDNTFLNALGGASYLTAPIVIEDELFGGIGLVFDEIMDLNLIEERKSEETFVSQVAEIFKNSYEKTIAEEKLREEKELLTSIMEASSTAILVLNTEGKILFANPSSESVLGIKLADVYKRTYDAPEWKNTSLDGGPWSEEDQPFTIVLKTKKPVTDIRHAIEDDFGNKKYLSINGSPVFDGEGNLVSLVFLVTDISENVIKQKALRDSEFKYRKITELTSSMVYDLEVKTGINYWAGAIEEVTGYSIEEYNAVGFDVWSEFIHPDDKARVLREIDECMSGKINFVSEYRYRTKSGNYVLVENNGVFIYDSLGEPIRMLGAMINRTERKLAEEKLKESEETLRLALDAAKMGIWSFDILNKKVYWSPQTYEIFKLTPESFSGDYEQFLNITYWEDRPVVLEKIDSLLSSKDKTDYFIQNRFNDPKGEIRWVEGRARLERSLSGEPIRLLGTVADITELKANEEALRSSEERFQTFYQFSQDAIVIFVATSLRIQDSNLAFQKLYGYSEEEIPDLKFRKLITRDSLQKIRKLLETESMDSLEVVGIKKSGDLFPALVTLRNYYDKGEIFIAYSILDTSSLKEVEQLKLVNAEINSKNKFIERQKQELENTLDNLKKTQAQLIHSEKLAALGQLIAGIAHEINNPIGAVKASNESMMDWQKSYGLASQLFRQALLDMTVEEKRATKSILERLNLPIEFYTGKEERSRKKTIRLHLESIGLEPQNANFIAESWVELGIGELTNDFLPALQSDYSKVLFDYFELESQFRRNTKTIQLAVDRVSKIMYALKNFSHFDATGVKTESLVTETIDMVLTIYQNQLRKGIDLIKDFDSIPPIYCYPDDLLHVWTNLIYNSLQAMAFKGKLTIKVQNLEKEIMVNITDSGPGIPLEIQEKIYEPFFTTKPAGEGSGLGLDIVKKIVKKHNGRILLDSVPGKTSFQIYLPKFE